MIALLGAGILLSFWAVYAKYTRLKVHMTVALTVLRDLQTFAGESRPSISGMDVAHLESLREDLARLEASLRGIKAEIPFFLSLCPHFAWIPGVGDEIAAVPSLLEMGIALSSAGGWAILGAEPLADLFWQRQTVETEALFEQVVVYLARSRPYFLEAEAAIERAMSERAKIEKGNLMAPAARLLERLDKYLPLIQMGARGALVAPELLGVDGSRRYLILAQNNHELRATGGFLSGIGLLTIQQGQLVEVDFDDAQAVDNFAKPHPAPPEPLARYMQASILLLRDANWSPDFPSSARVIASLYRQERDVAVDGVIAVDTEALRLLVEALGPLHLAKQDEWVDGSNIMAKIMEYWSSPPEEGASYGWWLHRKDFMDDLMSALVGKLREDPGAIEPLALFQALQQALVERHILVYLNNEAVSELLARYGWDGRILPASGDYLFVVDSNLGYNKVNPNIEQAIHYQVRLTGEGNAQAEATITYRNKSSPQDSPCVHRSSYDLDDRVRVTYAEMMEGCYWDYVRLYVPAGSNLRQVTGSTEPVDILQEHGKTVFGTFFVVPPGETHELRFLYDLPLDVVSFAGYHLTVQKQPGTPNIPVRVDIELAHGMSAASASSVEIVGEKTLRQQSFLDSDRYLEIRWRQGAAPRRWFPISLLAVGLLFLSGGILLHAVNAGRDRLGGRG